MLDQRLQANDVGAVGEMLDRVTAEFARRHDRDAGDLPLHELPIGPVRLVFVVDARDETFVDAQRRQDRHCVDEGEGLAAEAFVEPGDEVEDLRDRGSRTLDALRRRCSGDLRLPKPVPGELPILDDAVAVVSREARLGEKLFAGGHAFGVMPAPVGIDRKFVEKPVAVHPFGDEKTRRGRNDAPTARRQAVAPLVQRLFSAEPRGAMQRFGPGRAGLVRGLEGGDDVVGGMAEDGFHLGRVEEADEDLFLPMAEARAFEKASERAGMVAAVAQAVGEIEGVARPQPRIPLRLERARQQRGVACELAAPIGARRMIEIGDPLELPCLTLLEIEVFVRHPDISGRRATPQQARIPVDDTGILPDHVDIRGEVSREIGLRHDELHICVGKQNVIEG